MLRILALVTILILSKNIQAQQPSVKEEKISTIKLLLKHSMKVIDNQIFIEIHSSRKAPIVVVKSIDKDEVFKHWLFVKPDFNFSISKSEYNIILNNINNIDLNNFVKLSNTFVISTDGYTCELEYGDNMHSIALKTKVPTSNTEKRKLQDYVNICNLILKAAKKGSLETVF